MDKAVAETLKLGYYYYSLVKICGILWLAKKIHRFYLKYKYIIYLLYWGNVYIATILS